MKLIDRLKTGDVIYTNCIDLAFCRHVGIVYDDGHKKRIFHNTPTMSNRYGGTICSESYEDFMKNRQVIHVLRTHATAEDILTVSRKNKKESYNEFFFNCEDYVLEVVEGHRRSDLRDAWKIAALGILIITFI